MAISSTNCPIEPSKSAISATSTTRIDCLTYYTSMNINLEDQRVPDSSATPASSGQPYNTQERKASSPVLNEVPDEEHPPTATAPVIPSVADGSVHSEPQSHADRPFSEEYLDKLRRFPYQTRILTEFCWKVDAYDLWRSVRVDDRCDVTWTSVPEDSNSPIHPSKRYFTIDELHSAIGEASRASSLCSFLVVLDPSPAVVRALGESFKVPIEFFASHSASGGVLEDEKFCERQPVSQH